ncbi:PAS domain-containing protein [Geomonas sp. RF6]|uniref:PAS domain-containing sensor histidine kinase n=1 Tax=Geomonas sp. RF6 TaxID=2897342 RepID=UPI001E606B57|nr:ATP-binding protein [Geomonas sp. RF6]UFS72250.1 PAS domain-containing protein [Geomonas sp. RF6]
MPSLLHFIMAVSVALQCVAVFMAIRLIRLTGALCAWILLSCAFLIQAVRRLLALFLVMEGSTRDSLAVESMGLLVSLLLVCGIWRIGPLFTRLKEAKEEVERGRDELARSHQELTQSETRYRTVANFTSDWEFWIAPDNTLQYISPSCQQICGYSAEEFYRDPGLIWKIIHPDDLPRYNAHTHTLMANGQPQPLDFRITTRDGEERWISHLCRFVVDTDGAPLGSRASNRDITERKRIEQVLHERTVALEAEVAERKKAQEALAAKQAQLEALNLTLEERVSETVAELREKDQMLVGQSRHAAMGEMISYIAHQWKHPLNNLGLVIQSMGHEYHSKAMTPEQMSLYVDRGMELISYMSCTINDFRDFFREDKRKVPFSVRESVYRAISLVEASLKDNDIAIVVEPGEDLQIEGLRNEYAQALLNVIGNAREALLERRVPQPLIRVRIFGENGRAVVAISDNAGGIPEGLLERIFEPYFTTKEEGKGTGIGLWMSKTIIEKNMGGRVSARNAEEGAQFRIEV